MESQPLDERIEWEARRVAAAFGVEMWEVVPVDGNWRFDGFGSNQLFVSWLVASGDAQCFAFEVRPKEFRKDNRDIWKYHGLLCLVFRFAGESSWDCKPHPLFNDFMARGLYRLGFEDERVWSQLPALSAHEKLELRLSLPREFWPQSWWDEAS